MHALIFEYYVHALIFENYYAYHSVTHTYTAGEKNIYMQMLTYRPVYNKIIVYVHNNFKKYYVDRKTTLLFIKVKYYERIVPYYRYAPTGQAVKAIVYGCDS